jgi:hypothetical protein
MNMQTSSPGFRGPRGKEEAAILYLDFCYSIYPSTIKHSKYAMLYNRVVQKPQFRNNFRLKNSKMRSILQDLQANRRLADTQPGY